MSEMSQFLAEYYGTNGTTKTASAAAAEPEQDDLVKRAQVELFVKVAAEQNIDIAKMPDEQVQQLFDRFIANTTKVASDDEGKKKEEAEKELEEKKAAAAEFAKYDFFGRQMAHAYVDELRKIAAAAGSDKTAAFPPGGFPFQKKEEGGKEHDEKKEHEGKEHDEKKEHEKEKKGSAPVLAATAGKSKKASAIDELAFKVALQKIAEAKLDQNEAAQRINAAVTLELLGESTKIASAQDINTAIEIRALEMLEAARYPVEWAKPTAA